jgi:hypothetical protein
MEQMRLILQILAGFIFLFKAYRLLKDDYPENQIVKASLLGLAISFVWQYLISFLGLHLHVFGHFMAVTVVVFVFSIRLDWRFWSVMEALAWPGLISLAVAYAGLIEGVVYLVFVLGGFFWRNYRNFRWYPSGRVGFFFLINLIFIAIFQIGLDFWQRWLIELSVWSLVLVSGISGVVLLSGREQRVK